ncbi:DUF1837 domain-containing protein [Herbaspirillum seropedicae]|uniref:HamA C-terminal domain-containing protein n=1 Tax=Herbaspirillum seropedicae TaxID=964 RepID=UPI000863913D|nr:DUF1837 domain-containing protein [Herbaspirillum seropedicae]AON53132.1 hypothetical protein Hsc_0828 [Herbaspirillum seropedicae]
MADTEDSLLQLKAALEGLLDKAELSKHVAIAAESKAPSQPATTLMHVRFRENKANVETLAQFLWQCATNYSLSRRRRQEIHEQIKTAPPGDLSTLSLVSTSVREAFLEFNKDYPHRSSEVGELLAYCIALEQLGAAQLLAKMALKTNNNMPVHGLDGIHGKVENGWLTLFFLESKLSSNANSAAKEFAESVAEFSNNKKQYRREYQLVKDLGNLDALSPTDKKVALDYFDIFTSSDTPIRERCVGVLLYSDENAFASLPPLSDDHAPGFYEEVFAEAYAKQLGHHQGAALKHLKSNKGEPERCRVYFVVVPDADAVRQLFYDTMGYVPSAVKAAKKSAKPKKIPDEKKAPAPKKPVAVKKKTAVPEGEK